mmetsp:Transcript_852/g.1864  ORF Transcript_852/g.1864 Transcript_852/m.1864 type:complete len:266 (-) Transcript_852:333-1130(-)
MWPAPMPTERSAMKESSVSPDLWDTKTPQPFRLHRDQASRLSVTDPIWFTLRSIAFVAFDSRPFSTLLQLVQYKSSPTISMRSPTLLVRAACDAKSSSSKGSSRRTMGKSEHIFSYNSTISAALFFSPPTWALLNPRSYVPSLKNSDAAGSLPRNIFVVWPALSMAFMRSLIPSSGLAMFGANPPSSPTAVSLSPYSSWMTFFRTWYVSAPILRASPKLSAPAGMRKNSWNASKFPAWTPPLITLRQGTGMTGVTASPPMAAAAS